MKDLINKKELTWADISYRQYNNIRAALEIEDETEREFSVAEAVYGDEMNNLPVVEYAKLKQKLLKFINKEVPTSIKVKNVTVNDREYVFDGMLGNITTAQYIDYQNYCKKNDQIKQFSVFFIPKGHKYNDGYDMLQVFEDILDMPITVLLSAGFFFKRLLELFIEIFQRSSLKQIRKLNLPKQMKKELITLMEGLSNSLVLSHSF